MKRWLVLLLVLGGGSARAAGLTATGDDIRSRPGTEVEVHGALRLRGELLYNLDLDRGLTPSGEPLFAVPLGDPGAQALTHADMRLRTDLSFYVPRAQLAVKARLDALDNLALGSLPDAPPTATMSQRPPGQALTLKRAWAEVLLPFGLLSAGRQGSHWGLGMLTHGGDCPDCDSGDAADRIALVTPLLGHLWALAYDFSASGPFTRRRDGVRFIDLDPSDDVRTVTFAVMRYHTPLALERRRRAGRSTFDYGAYLTWRWQQNDVPASYLPLAVPAELGPTAVMARDFQALGADLWLRLETPRARLELEAALLWGRIGQASLVPGVLLEGELQMLQWGLALESEWRPAERWRLGFDAGLASGDPAPGFGARPRADQQAPLPGDLDGPQAQVPRDLRVDNFRFHPDYRVDRILFREIVGTVTDACYLRPHLAWTLLELGPGRLVAGLAAVFSLALEPASTPGGARPLGLEIDPTLAYHDGSGFSAVLEYALLIPFAGLDNPPAGLEARTAQSLRLRLGFEF